MMNNTPEYYKEQMHSVYTELRKDLTQLLLEHYNGKYVHQDGNPYLKMTNIIGTPIVYEIFVDDDNELIYKSGFLSGNFLMGSSHKYKVFDDALLNLYTILHKIIFEG